MRCAVIALLVAIPTALTTWVVSKGLYDRPPAEVLAPTDGGSVAAAPEREDPDAALKKVFASAVAGASLDGELAFYDGEGLFEYINGAAPIFIERSFRKLAAAELKTDTGGELTCDIYDMSEAENAASIFEKEQPPRAEPFEVGDGGRLSAMALVFKKGRYYVKLTAFDGPGEDALPAVAAAVSERLE